MAEIDRLKEGINNRLTNVKIVTKKLVTTKFLGNYKSVFKGTGLEFDGYRYYNYGDDASLIDWVASKKAHRPLVKEFIEERNLDVFFIIDASSGMLTGSASKLKFEYISELISTIAYSVASSGDRIGFVLYSNSIIKQANLSNKKGQFSLLLDNMINYQNYSGFFNFSGALKYALDFVDKNSIVFVVSDFITPIGWEDDILLASKKFDLICLLVRDPLDLSIPNINAEITLKDPYTNEQLVVEPNKIKESYEIEAKKQLNYIINQFSNNQIDYLQLRTDVHFLQPLIEFFMLRKKKYR